MVTTRKWGLLLSLASTSVFAQEGITTGSAPVARRNVVTVSVPVGSDSQVALEGERVVGERISLGLGVFTSLRHQRARTDEPPANVVVVGRNSTQYQLGLSPAVRFYLTGTAPQGLWVSPRVEVGYARSDSTTVPVPVGAITPADSFSETVSLGGMAVVGYSVVLEPGLSLQAGVGLGARHDAHSYDVVTLGPNDGTASFRVRETNWNFTQRLLFNVGWAF
ncbi:hypothetical protein [Corallococcus terminator]|uniref:Outer membrane protein beta-barrel domain-containing protein n=1 Tax=Corallococcus terminator TaxID=2316733 RepID=A0A3A8JCU6_9BACT|nr:hypothetical protein [Corallococcus terminator]RKG93542.1 hypothetical protein D7V88_02315 [Corallococcus terminator]